MKNPPKVHKKDIISFNDISLPDLVKIIMEFSTGDESVETPQPTTTNNMKETRFNMQRRVQKDHNRSIHRAYMTRTSIEQDSLEANPNVVSTDLDTTNISPTSSKPPSKFTTYFEDMFQKQPKPVRFGGQQPKSSIKHHQ
jgi:hypothetical protein